MQPASQNGWYNMGDGFGGVPPLKTEQLSPALSPRELRSPARNNVRTPQSLMPPNNMNYTPPNPSPITPRSDQHPSLQMSIPQFTQSGPSAFYSYVTKAEGINFPPITQSGESRTRRIACSAVAAFSCLATSKLQATSHTPPTSISAYGVSHRACGFHLYL